VSSLDRWARRRTRCWASWRAGRWCWRSSRRWAADTLIIIIIIIIIIITCGWVRRRTCTTRRLRCYPPQDLGAATHPFLPDLHSLGVPLLQAWARGFNDMAYFPARKAFGRLSNASRQDRLDATIHQFDTLAAQIDKEEKKVRAEKGFGGDGAGYTHWGVDTGLSWLPVEACWCMGKSGAEGLWGVVFVLFSGEETGVEAADGDGRVLQARRHQRQGLQHRPR
jgi:hypothetical protein